MRDAKWQPPSDAAVAKAAARRACSAAEARAFLEAQRENQIEAQQKDPYRHGYEPPIWLVARALLRNGTPTQAEQETVFRRTGMEWDEWRDRTREACGFRHGVAEMLIMGANRSGKTDFASRMVVRRALEEKAAIDVGFQSLPTGKQIQMPRIYNYLPRELKKTVKTEREYIAYSEHNGFSGSRIIFRNGSDVRFITYEMKVKSVLEGSALDLVWLDEEFGFEWLEAARNRVSSKRGTVLCTFTPVSGLTPVVNNYLAKCEVTRWHTAYMLPLDGAAPLPWRELNLSRAEYERLKLWRDKKISVDDPGVPESRPEDCLRWCFGPTIGAPDLETEGRKFARLPRVAVAHGGEAAVVWFYGSDNPYGLPGELIEQQLKNANATALIKKRVYGIAEKIKGRMFAAFTRAKNVVGEDEIPRDGVRAMAVDPAPERNWTWGYYLWHAKTKTLYKYRDWPGDYEIPGVGYPGPWAVSSDKNDGVNDGARGDAQDSWGFSFLAYKFEWARLEGWRDYEDWLAAGHGPDDRPQTQAEWDEVQEWSETDGVRERMELRVVDARAASQSKITMRDNRSLFEDVSELAEGFQPASGQPIAVGAQFLADLIAEGRYKVSERCVNTIFAYETYTGRDGQKGACKEWIDQDRYMVLSGITEYADSEGGVPADVQEPAARQRAQGVAKKRIRAGGRRSF